MNIETGKFLSIVFNVEYDATNKKNSIDTFLKIDVTALRSGLLQYVRGSELTVLLAIASFMNKEGECYPTQRQIAEITGLSLTTVNKSVANLLDIKINGMPILERSLRGSGQKKNSVYTIFDIAPEDIPVEDNRDIDSIVEPESHVEPEEIVTDVMEQIETAKPKNSKDVAHYYADKFKEAYGKSYVINYKRDLGLIKNKLVNNFTIDEILLIIDTCLAEYPTRWGNNKYPYPTIGMLCSWVCNEVVKLMLSDEQNTQKTNELIDATKGYVEETYSDFMDL